MTYYMYKDNAKQWRWYLMADNNKKIADSGEGYHNKDDCLRGINLVKMSSGAKISEV